MRLRFNCYEATFDREPFSGEVVVDAAGDYWLSSGVDGVALYLPTCAASEFVRELNNPRVVGSITLAEEE